MANDLVTTERGGLFAGLRARAEGYLRQLLAPIETPITAGYGVPAEPPFPPRLAMSALAAFPWVRACVRAKCDDVGGLRLVVTQGADGTDQVADHPVLRLLRRPSPGVTRTRLLRQIVLDLALAGNAYLWLRSTGPDEWELHRLHPEQVRADVRRGVLVGWVYGGERRLSVAEVFHVADVSWNDDLSALYGESPIRTLKDGLTTVRKTREFAARQAGKGRPDAVITYPAGAQLGPKGLREVVTEWTTAMIGGQGVFALAGGGTVTPMGWTAKDVDFGDLDTRVRDETLAVLRVPPTRAGIPQANYAVAKAELRDYWGSLVVAELQLIAEALTEIAHVVGGTMADEVRFDVSSVEALQTSYDQRQARAGFWVTVMGASPRDAARYEGFRDAPVGDQPGGQNATRPAREVDDQPNRQAQQAEHAIAAWLAAAAERLQGGEPSIEAEAWRLTGLLELAGLEHAEQVAWRVAPVVCEAARLAGADTDLSELWAFSRDHARAIASTATTYTPAANPSAK